MNTQELAKAFTDMCAKGELEAAGKKFWSDDIVSREPMTGDMAELKGRKAVEGKTQWWNANHEVHDLKVEGPYVHGGFTRSGTVGSSRKAFSWVAGNPNRIAASGSACSKRLCSLLRA